jgi:hypothetical protein
MTKSQPLQRKVLLNIIAFSSYLFLFILFFTKDALAQTAQVTASTLESSQAQTVGTNFSSSPLSAKLYSNYLDAKVGDTIILQLKINPRPDKPVYTVSASLMYDPSILDYLDASFTDSLFVVPVPKAPYSLTDTENGMIRRTAGFPNGTTELVPFTTYKFKAVRAGDAKISVEDGIALDETNTDIGLQQKQLTIHISDNVSIDELEDEPLVPEEHTVQMSLDILGPVAIYKEESYTFPIDTLNLKDEDVKAKIYVYNDRAELFYTEDKRLSAKNTEPVYFTIPANTLPVGKFVISVESINSSGQSKIIAQKTIGVLSNNETWATKHKTWLLPLFLFISVLAIVHHLMKDRDLYFLAYKMIKTRKKKEKKKMVKIKFED